MTSGLKVLTRCLFALLSAWIFLAGTPVSRGDQGLGKPKDEATDRVSSEEMEKQSKMIEGTWKKVQMSFNGVHNALYFNTEPYFTFQKGEFEISNHQGKSVRKGTWKFNEKKMEIGLAITAGDGKGTTLTVRYECDGGNLYLATDLDADKRPGEMITPPDSGARIYKYTRIEAAPNKELNSFFIEVRKLVEKQYPTAKVSLKGSTIHFEFHTRKFMIHHKKRVGNDWEDASEESGPQPGGILGDIELRQGKYNGTHTLPSAFDTHYFTVFVSASYSKKLDRHLYTHLKYPQGVSKEFLNEFRQLVEAFETHLTEMPK